MYDSETVLLESGAVRLAEGADRQPARARIDSTRADWDAVAVRALDVTISVLALVFLAPLLIFVAVAVYFTDPGPIFFAHRRIGRDGQAFPCLKFRSMVIDADRHPLLWALIRARLASQSSMFLDRDGNGVLDAADRSAGEVGTGTTDPEE